MIGWGIMYLSIMMKSMCLLVIFKITEIEVFLGMHKFMVILVILGKSLVMVY